MEWLRKINMQEKKTDRKKRHNGAFLFSRNLLAPKYPGPYCFFDGQKAFLFQRKNLVLFFWCDDIPLKNCCEPGFYLLSLSPFGIFFGYSWKEALCIFLWKATGGFVRCCSSYHLSQYASLTCISAGRANPLGLGCTKAPAIYILKSEVSACGVRH